MTYHVAWSLTASRELDSIWEWNVVQYGRDHADRYVTFLVDCVEALAQDRTQSRPVKGQPDTRYIVMKWRPRGYGHVAVFDQQDELQRLDVLHIFHTRQNWQQILADDGR